jgi:hypothetical protein
MMFRRSFLIGVAATLVVTRASHAQTFIETFNNAPDYTNNWHVAADTGSTQISYTTGKLQMSASQSYPYPPGSHVTLSTNSVFTGDIDVTFQFNHQGYGRTNVGLVSQDDSKFLAVAASDTNDTDYLNFIVPPNSTEYEYASSPYMNRPVAIRVVVQGLQVSFYAGVDGNTPVLLKTWTFSSSPGPFRLALDVGSVPWKSGDNITSFRLVSASATPNGPLITSVSPNPVPAFNGQQTFTITGNNFNANCSVTLRQVSTGQVFPNRTKYFQTANQIVLKPNFTTTVSAWTVEVINPDGSSSGQFPFNVSNARITSIAISGPPSVDAGTLTDYFALATYSDGTQRDVTSQAYWTATGGPADATGNDSAVMQDHSRTLVTGLSSVSTVPLSIVARVTDAGGQVVSAPYQVIVGLGDRLGVGMSNPQISFQRPSGNDFVWRIRASLYGSAFVGQTPTIQWSLGGQVISQSGQNLDYEFTGQPSTLQLAAIVTDAQGRTGTDSRPCVFNRPAPNEPGQKFPAQSLGDGTYLDQFGQQFAFDANRIDNGLVVITHGLRDQAYNTQNPWPADMANAITTRLANENKPIPNIVLYDWKNDANPAIRYGDGNDDQGWAAATLRVDRSIFRFFNADLIFGILAVRPFGIEHGDQLAYWINYYSQPGSQQRINPTKPIQLIGHSAGGFVVGQCAWRLKRDYSLKVSQVTMLDTPDPVGSHFTYYPNPPNPGRVERYISSFYGALAPELAGTVILPTNPPTVSYGTVEDAYHHTREVKSPLLFGFADHDFSYKWYTNTVNDASNFDLDGFYNSPFEGSNWPTSGANQSQLSTVRGRVPVSKRSEIAAAYPNLSDQPISGFTTFGNVTSSGTQFTLSEDTNAGIFQNLNLPVGAQSLNFTYQFTTPGDGDYLAVYFGENPPLYVASDFAGSENAPLLVQVPIAQYAGQTGTLVIELISRGQKNAVVQLDQIALTISDDADFDGLTNDQEAALGTNPLVWDTDGDGLGDGDEVNIYNTNPLLVDSDGDGASDGNEIAAGTDPNSASSIFRIISVQPAVGGGLAITWTGNPSATYSVLRSFDLSFANYDVIASGIPGNAATYTDTTIPPERTTVFYKVRIDVDVPILDR